MKNLPITLIIVLTSSLFVALIIIPVFSATFIRVGPDRKNNMPNKKRGYIIAGILMGLGGLFYLLKWNVGGSLAMIFGIDWFVECAYFSAMLNSGFRRFSLFGWKEYICGFLHFLLRKYNPIFFFIGTIFLLIFTIGFFMARDVNITFFPENEPSYINVITEMPIGTDVTATNTFVFELEKDIEEIIQPYRELEIVKSVLTTVGSR